MLESSGNQITNHLELSTVQVKLASKLRQLVVLPDSFSAAWIRFRLKKSSDG